MNLIINIILLVLAMIILFGLIALINPSFLALLFVVAIFVAELAISFALLSGLIYGILWCFGATAYFTWKLALGIFLVCMVLKSIFGHGGDKK